MRISKRIYFVIFFFLSIIQANAQEVSIKFHYLGHASFLIIFDDSISVLTDYGKPNAFLNYGWNSPIFDIGDFQPTIVTYSHPHPDHYDSTRTPSHAKFILKNGDSLGTGNLTIIPIPTSEYNDSAKDNTSYLFLYKGIKILHLGDCQANIFNIDSAKDKAYVKNTIPTDCDVVLMPIESIRKFIPQTKQFIELIHLKIIIPMHYWSREYKSEFLNFLEKNNDSNDIKYKVIHCNGSNYTYRKMDSAASIEVIDLDPSSFNEKNR